MPLHQSLVDLNPDKLFEEHTISEIKEIHKKLQAEIERKRVEIRTMVGERYRDLIQAADTISDMQSTSKGIITHIQDMSGMCEQLQHVHLLGFKQDSAAGKQQREAASAAYHAVVVQVRILVLLPEQIWTALDEQDFLKATQLYLLASSITNSLKLNIGVEGSVISGDKIIKWFPVILSQWNTIRSFHNLILAGCERKLQTLDLTTQDASRCLAVLVLLGGGSSLAQAQTRLLSLRTEALRIVLRDDQPTTSLRNQVRHSLMLTLQTLNLLINCFQGSGEDSVASTLENIVSPHTPPVSALLDCMNDHTSAHLPMIIKDFRPHHAQRIEGVSSEQIEAVCEKWLLEIQEEVKLRLGHLLSYVSSVHGIQAIREVAYSAFSESCEVRLPGGATAVWEKVFRLLLTQRVCAIIEQQLQQIAKDSNARLEQALKDLTTDKMEQDLRWFVWREFRGDLPSTGGWMSQAERTVNQAGSLQMKALGYSPGVQQLCHSLDAQLHTLLEDLHHYTKDSRTDRLAVLLPVDILQSESSADKFVDRPEIQQHLQVCTIKCIQDIIAYVKKKVTEAGNDASIQETSLMLLGRFLHALCDQCPHLQKCMHILTTWDPNKATVLTSIQKPSNEWQQLSSQLTKESLDTFHSWERAVTARLQNHLSSTFAPVVTIANMLDTLPQWEIIKIEEEGMSSQIRVPSQPSLPLQTAFHMSCQELNAQAPHAIPRLVHQEFVATLVKHLLSIYCELSQSEIMYQSVALQALFDVRYISSLLILRDTKALADQAQSVCEKLESKIDPFDLDVFQPYLQSNIKKSIHRTQHLFGCLVPPAKLAVLSGVRMGATGSEAPSPDDPFALPLSSRVPWFPLLPVASPALLTPAAATATVSVRSSPSPVKSCEITDKNKAKKTSFSSGKIDPSPSALVRSGAAALFEAMSSEWFGGSS